MELFVTVVGSHMWHMERSDSDTDLFVVERVPLRDVLLGKVQKSKHIQSSKTNTDQAVHEIGHVTSQLKKGNVNHVWGVMSPIVVSDEYGYLSELRQIHRKNLSKNIFHSIHGLAIHNYKKYIEDNPRTLSADKLNKKGSIVVRTLRFGIEFLSRHTYCYDNVESVNLDDIPQLIQQLQESYDQSTLPDIPQRQDLYDDWLIKLRLKEKLK